MIVEAIDRALRRIDLTEAEAECVATEVMDGAASPVHIAGWLVALRAKGEAVDEIAGIARAMRARAVRLPNLPDAFVIDTCGTGGDGAHTFNVSTAAGLVAAAAGATVAKHGNRAVSSRCGSADLLEAAGVRIDAAPAVAARSLADNRFAFLFAPNYHVAMKHAAPVRRELGVRTVFNLVGPLVNPVPVKGQLLGVFDRVWLRPMASALHRLGVERALVVCGEDGVDEISIAAPTRVVELFPDGGLAEATIRPEDFGLTAAHRTDVLRGGDKFENARTLASIFDGETGSLRDAVVINAAAALYVAKIATTFGGGVHLARAAIDRGDARALLERVRTTYGVTDE